MKKTAICFIALCVLLVVFSPVTVIGQEEVYRGNVSSRIFHSSDCRYYNCSSCTAKFDTREAAIKAGYRPCKICKP